MLGHAHGRRIERSRQRFGQRDTPREFVRIVARAPRPRTGHIDCYRRIHHRGIGRKAKIHGRPVDERLERRARLPFGLNGAVELSRDSLELSPADHGADRTIRAHDHDRGLRL